MKKQKVGIITLIDYNNYGNRLQNYALQEVLKDLGCDVQTILIDKSIKTKRRFIEKIKSFTFRKLFLKIKAYIRKMGNFRFKKTIVERKQNFIHFTKEYIYESGFALNKNYDLNSKLENYDFFIVGSDQVWNPFFIGNNYYYFLDFAPKDKRIAYAASFGISNLPENYKKIYTHYISQIDKISVREKEGTIIVRELINRDVPVVLDPTLLLSKESWLSIINSNSIKEDYILLYFLDKPSKETKKKINQLKSNFRVKIIDLLNKKDSEVYTSSPIRFLELINSASIVLTDSFHGTVFSILFKKPFIVFKRNRKSYSMFSRIETLLSTFKLESRYSVNIKVGQEFICDFSHVDHILNEERSKSIDFLKKALRLE